MRTEVLRLVLGLAALALVLYGAASVLDPFARPIIWAATLGLATWPVYRRLRDRMPGGDSLAALVMIVVLVLGIVLPVGGLGMVLAYELEPIVGALKEWSPDDRLPVPDSLRALPIVNELVERVESQLADPELRRTWISRWTELAPGGAAARVGRTLLQNTLTLLLTLFTIFFVYRDGEAIALELRVMLDRIAGGKGMTLLSSVRVTVRAVFYGWLMTAACQGLLAMLGYWIAGLQAPVVLGLATGLAAVIPFGISLVWIPAAIGLAAQGAWGSALFLTIWSSLVVGLVDNLLRPLFISGPSRIPFILVFFGLIGGLAAYGPLGLVLGPVLLGVLLALWRTARESLAEAS
jgi:predicted PurR-regulated permease PerM